MTDTTGLTAEERAERIQAAKTFMEAAGAMLGRGEMPAPATPYAVQWHAAHATLLTVLEEAEGRITEALTMTGCRDVADLIDMANVGRSTMDRMAEVVASGPLKGWSPADDPAEIITDLANKLDDALHDYGNAESEAKGAEADVADLTARAEKAEQQRDLQVSLIMDACDLLAERTYGNDARSPAHNARLMLEEGLQRIESPNKSEAENG